MTSPALPSWRPGCGLTRARWHRRTTLVRRPHPGEPAGELATNSALAERVRTALKTAYHDAVTLIARRQAAVEVLAAALQQCEALDGDEAAGIVAAHPATSDEEHAS